MSDSELYKNGGTVTTSNINKQNAQLAAEYKNKMANDEKDRLYGMAREEGIREGSDTAYMDVMRRLNSSNQYSPIIEGSHEDVRMQANVDRGVKYQTSEEPGLLDAIGERLGNASEWFNRAEDTQIPQEKSQLQKDQEFEQTQYESEQAGLAELKQLLNSQQTR